jgi:hypothetical protein
VAFGTDECLNPRECLVVKRAVLELLGGLMRDGLAWVDGHSRKRVVFADVVAAMQALGCDGQQEQHAH